MQRNNWFFSYKKRSRIALFDLKKILTGFYIEMESDQANSTPLPRKNLNTTRKMDFKQDDT